MGFPPAAGAAQGQAGLLFEFLRKVLKLTSFRLALLCENFDFSPLEGPEVNSKVGDYGGSEYCRIGVWAGRVVEVVASSRALASYSTQFLPLASSVGVRGH